MTGQQKRRQDVIGNKAAEPCVKQDAFTSTRLNDKAGLKSTCIERALGRAGTQRVYDADLMFAKSCCWKAMEPGAEAEVEKALMAACWTAELPRSLARPASLTWPTFRRSRNLSYRASSSSLSGSSFEAPTCNNQIHELIKWRGIEGISMTSGLQGGYRLGDQACPMQTKQKCAAAMV